MKSSVTLLEWPKSSVGNQENQRIGNGFHFGEANEIQCDSIGMARIQCWEPG